MKYFLVLFLCIPTLHGQISSFSYEIDPLVIDGGGGVAQSSNYEITTSSIGGIIGEASSLNYRISSGYVSQIPMGTVIDLNDYDSWKTQFFPPTATNMSRSDDADGDGVNNEEEFLALTDPTDSTSFFKVEILADATTWDIAFAPMADETRRIYTLFHGEAPDSIQTAILGYLPLTLGTSGFFDNVPRFGDKEFYRVQIDLASDSNSSGAP